MRLETQLQSSPPYGSFNTHRWKEGKSLDWHQHNFLQFIHIQEGFLEVDFGSGFQEYKARDLIMLPPHRPHRLRSERGHRQFGLNFSPQGDERGILEQLLGLIHEAFPEGAGVLQADIPNADFFRDQELHQLDGPQRFETLHSIDAYVLQIIRQLQDNDTFPSLLMSAISEQLHEAATVDSLSQHCSMARSTLQLKCKLHFGCGVLQLFNRYKVRAAAQQLANTDTSIGNCATHFGFPDIYSFSRSFKREMGMSPKQFRQWKDAER